jgi:hypothetical protein
LVPTLRQELNDLRQREIERQAARSTARRTRRPAGLRISALVASALHRIADRLESAPDLPVETARVVVRQP